MLFCHKPGRGGGHFGKATNYGSLCNTLAFKSYIFCINTIIHNYLCHSQMASVSNTTKHMTQSVMDSHVRQHREILWDIVDSNPQSLLSLKYTINPYYACNMYQNLLTKISCMANHKAVAPFTCLLMAFTCLVVELCTHELLIDTDAWWHKDYKTLYALLPTLW